MTIFTQPNPLPRLSKRVKKLVKDCPQVKAVQNTQMGRQKGDIVPNGAIGYLIDSTQGWVFWPHLQGIQSYPKGNTTKMSDANRMSSHAKKHLKLTGQRG